MQEIGHLSISLTDLPDLDDHPFVKRLPDTRHNVLLHHRVVSGADAWHVITRRLLDIALPEADNAWSYETAIFPEHLPNQPDLARGRYTRYAMQRAAISGHGHSIQRLLQRQATA
ncbi:MAG TPA: hypothetical protein VH599_00375 [Ktedonobacterales bacterium]|jgi:hypothetical protein